MVPQLVLCGGILLSVMILGILTLQDTGKVCSMNLLIILAHVDIIQEILSRDQCYEWRGLMLILLILMDYSGHNEVSCTAFSTVMSSLGSCYLGILTVFNLKFCHWWIFVS